MPGDPEADELRALEGVGGEGVTDLRIEVLHAPGERRERLGDDVLVEVVVVPGPAIHSDPATFGALALVAAEIYVPGVCRMVATSSPRMGKNAGMPPHGRPRPSCPPGLA